MLKKNLPKNVKDFSKEELVQILKKKKECNVKALKIVQHLSEECATEDFLLNSVKYINQEHYDDVVTERSISQVCGYPLCSNNLSNVPKQQYRISLSQKMVYDITDRKKYCSNWCYKSSEHLKNQIMTSPLWYRESEKIPIVKLLSHKNNLREKVINDNSKKEEEEQNDVISIEDDGSVRSSADSRIVENSTSFCDFEKDNCGGSNFNEDISTGKEVFKDGSSTKIDLNEECSNDSPEIDIKEGSKKYSTTGMNSKQKCTENSSAGSDVKLKCQEQEGRHLVPETPNRHENFLLKVEIALKEWFSLKTYVFLVGEEAAKTAFRSQQSVLDLIIENKEFITPYHKKFDDMTMLYSLLDLAGNQEDMDLKPLPDYSVVKAEAESLSVKVRAFYSGQATFEASSSRVPVAGDGADDSLSMPLVDSQAQVALRRRVLIDRLNRTIPDLCISLQLSDTIEVSDVRSLVKTFALSPHNVTFKPREWDLISVIIIKLMSVKMTKLKDILSSDVARQRLTLILMSFDLPYDYLDNLLEWLLDTNRLLETMQT